MHCLHTSTQLLINSNVLSSRGDIFFYLFIVIIITIVILFIVFYHLNLAILSLQKKNYIFRILFKKKRIYSIFNQKSFKGMCCFFRTTVTSFCVKSHSRNSHLCVEEPVWSRAALWFLTRNHINSSGTYKIQRNLPGHWSDLGDVQFIIAGCRSFGSSGNVC